MITFYFAVYTNIPHLTTYFPSYLLGNLITNLCATSARECRSQALEGLTCASVIPTLGVPHFLHLEPLFAATVSPRIFSFTTNIHWPSLSLQRFKSCSHASKGSDRNLTWATCDKVCVCVSLCKISTFCSKMSTCTHDLRSQIISNNAIKFILWDYHAFLPR